MTVELVRYQGRRADGAASVGSTDESPVELVERYFDAGWRELVVLRDGEIVGAIERSRGKRIWWAEDS
jgi:hypothetical protein